MKLGSSTEAGFKTAWTSEGCWQIECIWLWVIWDARNHSVTTELPTPRVTVAHAWGMTLLACIDLDTRFPEEQQTLYQDDIYQLFFKMTWRFMRFDCSLWHWRGQNWAPFGFHFYLPLSAMTGLSSALANISQQGSNDCVGWTTQHRWRWPGRGHGSSPALHLLLPWPVVGNVSPPHHLQPLLCFLQQQLLVLKIVLNRVVVAQLWTSQKFTGVLASWLQFRWPDAQQHGTLPQFPCSLWNNLK